MDTEWYRHSSRLDITEETKIQATKEEADEFYGATMDVDSKPNFISDIFFLLNAFQRLGLVKTIDSRNKANKNSYDMEKELKQVESREAEFSGVRSWSHAHS